MIKIRSCLLILIGLLTGLLVGFHVVQMTDEIEVQKEVMIAMLINIGELKEEIDLNREALIEMIEYVFEGEREKEEEDLLEYSL